MKNKNQGIIYVPYIIAQHTPESLKRYDEFMDKYHKDHECCPKCGTKEHMSTLMGYVLDKEEDYKDLNSCVCSKCGDSHTAHDRVKEEK